jgi:hypothetical protein
MSTRGKSSPNDRYSEDCVTRMIKAVVRFVAIKSDVVVALMLEELNLTSHVSFLTSF